eukprot:TRINITY_DN189_c1_g1_i1.p1 TRINITY_DN189_c1_g1~~TRINITY_DN189_c1_g1_i1.p1  ORF type:complete len:595 (+),score=112.55 TRINITY_DN189_c1_g1_i1:255-1787(+)
MSGQGSPEPSRPASPASPYRILRPPPLQDDQSIMKVGLVAGERCPRSPPPAPRPERDPADRPVQKALTWSASGRWLPVTMDTVRQVKAEVADFAAQFHTLKAALEKHALPVEAEGPARRRLAAMQRSAELRIDILTDFYTAHKKDPRAESVKQGVKALRSMAPSAPATEEAPSSPQVTAGPETLSRVSPRATARSPPHRGVASQPPAASVRLETTSSARQHAGAVVDGDFLEMSIADRRARLQRYEADEGHLQSRLQAFRGQEIDRAAKVSELEMEAHRLEKACLELSEGRERMRGMVEEQVYAATLLFRVNGLLHFELRRTMFASVSRLLLFWAVPALFLLHTVLTSGQSIAQMHKVVRGHFGDAGPVLVVFDMFVFVATAASVREWFRRAAADIRGGGARVMLQAFNYHDSESERTRCIQEARAWGSGTDTKRPQSRLQQLLRDMFGIKAGGKKSRQTTQTQQPATASPAGLSIPETTAVDTARSSSTQIAGSVAAARPDRADQAGCQ